ncbi:hypothetical protein LCGC14_0668860 [marine sediment metagenome]|uniref:DUF2695 domain-containing protein n=1 Tax=marine sediment metagenome TaxID=412755 RepID=A0A0F9QRH3_9ZZZZ|nr:MAG: hypothetical protein Lokiarch_14300 [Candidatus Lokiarchaeum sp. GC14_75]
MKKERTIIIRDPKLKKIRNGLRTILGLWRSDIACSLLDQASQNTMDKERSRDIQKKISELNLQYQLSICVCLHCGHSDKDMIFVPEWKQWLCIECNTERVYFEDLRANLPISNEKIEEFFDKLGSDDGIGLSRRGSKCNGYTASRKILNEMGVIEETQGKFFELSEYYGGYCDCEIILNAKPRFLEDIYEI